MPDPHPAGSTDVVVAPRPHTVFIACSSDAAMVANKIHDVLRQPEYADFTPLKWKPSFMAGDFTLARLLENAAEVEFSIFVFAADDTRESRGTQAFVTRDNVILEFGLFVANNGPARSAIFRHVDVVLPTDADGLGVKVFPSHTDDYERFNEVIEREIRTLVEGWRGVGPRRGDGGLGFADTLAGARLYLDRVEGHLLGLGRQPAPRGPIRLAAGSVVEDAYCEGLCGVRQRFWTTTYFSSPFWTRGQSDSAAVVTANAQMMRTLRAGPTEEPDARRLFLLDAPPREALGRWRETLIHSRHGAEAGLEAHRLELANLRRNVRAMVASGFQVRVAHDRDRTGAGLYADLGAEELDSELAVYDDRRIDVFDGGSVGHLLGLQSYCAGQASFDGRLAMFTAYFEGLWAGSTPADEFLGRMEATLDHVEHRIIDYRPNWLAAYEYALDDQDRAVKETEEAWVAQILADRGFPGRSIRYLDIGTCTGRYPFALADLGVGGQTWAVDSDGDCIDFCRGKERARPAGDTPITWVTADFLALDPAEFADGQGFDLVTCMLGTVSHFGFDRDLDTPARDDSLQEMLVRCAELLADDGLLLIGSWSDRAVADGKLLSIYRDVDVARLCRWTPSATILGSRLHAAGFQGRSRREVHPRLDVWTCTRTGP